MFRPGHRFVHPEFGDVTADLLEELNAMARLDEPVILEREAALMAKASGQVARQLTCGRVVAEFPEEVYDAWTRSHGKEFFSKKRGGDGVEYLTKHFPQTRVHTAASPGRETVAMARNRYRVTGKRGRWAA